jgi:hypothetical protein
MHSLWPKNFCKVHACRVVRFPFLATPIKVNNFDIPIPILDEDVWRSKVSEYEIVRM